MDTPRPHRTVRAVGLLVAVATTAVLWLAASPPATSTMAPGAASSEPAGLP